MRNKISNDTSTVNLITLKQAAAILQVCVKTVRRLIDKRQVPIFRVGNRVRMRADHVALLLEKE